MGLVPKDRKTQSINFFSIAYFRFVLYQKEDINRPIDGIPENNNLILDITNMPISNFH